MNGFHRKVSISTMYNLNTSGNNNSNTYASFVPVHTDYSPYYLLWDHKQCLGQLKIRQEKVTRKYVP